MAEPSEGIIAKYSGAVSGFWGATPLTDLINNWIGATNETKGLTGSGILTPLLTKLIEGLVDADWFKDITFEWDKIIYGMLKNAGMNTNDIQGLINVLNQTIPDQPIAKWIAKLGLSSMAVFSILGAFNQAVDKSVGKMINKTAKLEIGDFDTAYTDFLRNGVNLRYQSLLDDLGYNSTWQQAFEESRRALLNTGEIGEALRRGVIAEEHARALLQQQGYKKGQEDQYLTKLMLPLQPIDMLLEGWKRSNIEESEVFDAIAKYGYKPDTIEHILENALPLFGTSEIVPLYRNGYMHGSETIERLTKLGYAENDIDHILNLGKHAPGEVALLQMVWRNVITETQYTEYMRKLGYDVEDIPLLKKIIWQPAPPSDTIRFAVREVYSPIIAEKFGLFEDFPEQFAQEGKKVGISRELAQQYWAAHWELPAPGQGFDMYHRGIITKGELEMLLKALDVMPFWREKMIRLNDRLIPRRQLRQLLETNVEQPDDIIKRYHALGYSMEDSHVLTAVDLEKLFQAEKDVTKADAVKAFVARLIDAEELSHILLTLNYSAEAIDFYVKDAERQQYLQDMAMEIGPNDKAAEKAKSDLTNDMLTDLGYYDETAVFFLAHADLVEMKRDLTFYSNTIKKMFDVTAIDSTEATRQLTEKGFDVNAARKLVAKWDFELYSENLVDKATPRNATKAEMKRWLKSGIINVDEYNNYLTDLGYDEYTRNNYILEVMIEVSEES